MDAFTLWQKELVSFIGWTMSFTKYQTFAFTVFPLNETSHMNCNPLSDISLTTFSECANYGLPLFPSVFTEVLMIPPCVELTTNVIIIHIIIDVFSSLQIATKSFGYHYIRVFIPMSDLFLFLASTKKIYVSWFYAEITNLTLKKNPSFWNVLPGRLGQ